MNLKHFCSAFVVAAALTAAVSCDKDKEQETLPSLDGNFSLKGELKEYILAENAGRTAVSKDFYGNEIPAGAYEIIPDGVRHPEGKEHQKYIGYYYKQTPPTPKKDGDSKTKAENDTTYTYNPDKELSIDEINKAKKGYVTFRKDTLYTCTVSFSAFAEGYYGLTASKQVTVVRGGLGDDASVYVDKSGFDKEKTGTVTDLQGKSYPYTYIEYGNRKWMQQNLHEEVSGAQKTDNVAVPFKNCEAMEDVFGLYYTYSQAENICPEGWRLPTEDDWKDLAGTIIGDDIEITGNNDIKDIAAAMMAEAYFNTADPKNPDKAARMWEWWPFMENGNGGNRLNTSGFSAIPTGYANSTAGEFRSSFKDGQAPVAKAMFWTKADEGSNIISYRYIDNDSNDLKYGSVPANDNSFAISVRCVAE